MERIAPATKGHQNGNGNGAGVHERIAALSPEKRKLVERLMVARSAGPAGPPPIVPRASNGPCPLSYAQELMWLVHELTPGTIHYNVSGARRLRGRLDVEVLERALDATVARHDALRTNFREVDGVPMQVVDPHARVPLRRLDLSGAPPEEREREIERVISSEVRHRFDLRDDVLMRATLIRCADDEHVLITAANHIVWDGWSKGVLFRELATLYDAFLNSRPSPLPEPSLQYADYAVWQREWLQGDVLDELIGYWRGHLTGAPTLLALPTDRPRPAVQTFKGSRQSLYLPGTVMQQLGELARHESGTLFMVLLGAVKVLLQRYSGQDDVVVGTPVASRNRTELEGLIGYFTNTLALRTDLGGDPSFRELIGRVRDTTLGALAHQDAPFEKVVQAVAPQRDLSHSPIFQVLFTLQNAAPETLSLTGMTMELLRTDPGTSKFDLSFGIGERWRQLHTSVEYSTDLFDHTTIERMRGHFGTLLQGIVADPDRHISELPLLGDDERRQVLVEWNERAGDPAPPQTLHGLFEASAGRRPDSQAVVAGESSLSYRELDERANRLARHLRSLGAGPGVRIGLRMERSLELATAALAVLKSGSASVPLDPSYPEERLAAMARDAGLEIVLTEERLRADAADIERQPAERLERPASPDDVAYVIYTSGSTGGPRGVLLTHGGLANHALASIPLYGFEAGDRVLQFSSISFDISLEETFVTWAAGATLVMRPPDAPIAGPGFLDLLEANGITVLDLPTAFWHEWVRDLRTIGVAPPESLRLVIVGGEKATGTALADWRELAGERVRWINTYGPSEASVVATAWEPPYGELPHGDPPIGRPIRGVKVYVLDSRMRPVPIGVPGELHIGGVGVAKGYLGRPELTAERFVQDPFGGDPDARLYRTGDLVRLRADGNLEFVGRTDDQLKLRGFRIEPGEIAAVLREHAAVEDAVVVGDEERGVRRLVAYAVHGERTPETVAELRRFLRTRLPAYMVPSAIVPVDALPLSANGKVDRSRLPRPPRTQRESEAAFVAPRDELEAGIGRIWAELLAVERIGVHDDFFALGGHSLLAVRMFNEIDRGFGVRLPLAELFRDPSIAHLAELVRQERAAGERRAWSPLVQLQPGVPGRTPLFLFPWVNGELLAYRDLVRHIDPDQPVQGIQARGLDGRSAPHRSIHRMAADYVADIRSLQPHGPYLLGGYCFSGTVAFEAARQLQEAGERVACVLLLGAPPYGHVQELTRVEKERAYATEFARRDLRGKLAWFVLRARNAHQKASDRVWWFALDQSLRTTRPLPRWLQDVQRVNKRARQRYVTPAVDCPAVLIRPAPVGDTAWARLARGGLTTVGLETPGIDHGNMVREPFVSELGATVDAQLARIAAELA